MCIGDAVSLEHHLATDQLRLAAALGVEIAAERDIAGDGLLERARIFVDHPDLEGRGTTEDVLGARGVLHARQLNDDAIDPLLLDDRLGDAQLVDAIAQDRDVLLDGARLDRALRLLLHAGDKLQLGR